MKRFENKTVVITGGANGIGKAAADSFLDEGANVCVWDFAEPASVVAKDNFLFCKVDVSKSEQCKQAAQACMDKFGAIHVLVNNAGITRDAMFAKMTEEQWSKVIDVNLNGVFNATKAVVDIMIKQKYGKIISTSSVVAHYGNIGQANYAATKGALISFTQTLAKELGKHNINVNAVSPGFIATDIVKTIPDNIIQAFTERSSLKRMGDPNDIANVYKFLASEDASYITGTVIQVDGGLSI
jgi:3-oxoacyl-[acyl-carrier protein] reductase